MSSDLSDDRLGLTDAANRVVGPSPFIDLPSGKYEYYRVIGYRGRDRIDVEIILGPGAAKDGG